MRQSKRPHETPLSVCRHVAGEMYGEVDGEANSFFWVGSRKPIRRNPTTPTTPTTSSETEGTTPTTPKEDMSTHTGTATPAQPSAIPTTTTAGGCTSAALATAALLTSMALVLA
ncbi:hypothetical protein TcWFU_009972 [Taenia crassiceps]|uniref:Uncharacterized protein n=1 Tax=Taenia crassiceps TaxID=6207 RepID=A0ABR4QBQ8_9CEST